MPVKRESVSATFVICAILACIGIGCALVLGLQFAPKGADSGSTPFITTVIGTIPLTVIALLGLLRADQARNNASEARNHAIEAKAGVEKINGKLEREISRLIAENMKQAKQTEKVAEIINGQDT